MFKIIFSIINFSLLYFGVLFAVNIPTNNNLEENSINAKNHINLYLEKSKVRSFYTHFDPDLGGTYITLKDFKLGKGDLLKTNDGYYNKKKPKDAVKNYDFDHNDTKVFQKFRRRNKLNRFYNYKHPDFRYRDLLNIDENFTGSVDLYEDYIFRFIDFYNTLSTKIASLNFKDGKLEGEQIEYYVYSRIFKIKLNTPIQIIYKNDRPLEYISKHTYEGKARLRRHLSYYPDGRLKLKITYAWYNANVKEHHKNLEWFYSLDSKVPDYQKFYYKNGQLKKFIPLNKFDDINGGETKRWYENGNIAVREIYNDENELYELRKYYESGKLHYIEARKKGKRHGEFVQYYESGKVFAKVNYKNGENHGLHRYWYENGQLRSIFHYQNDEKHGPYKRFYDDGCLKYYEILKNGKSISKIEFKKEDKAKDTYPPIKPPY